jgi:transketolase
MEALRRRFPRLHYVRFASDEERAEMNGAIAAELGIEPVDLGGGHG